MTGPTFESTLPDALARAENLPSLPAVAVEVLRLCEDEASTVKDLAQAVHQDPALVVKMLKLANSSLFSLGHPVTSLDHAAMVLGMKTVKLMSLSFSLAQTLPKDGPEGFDYEGYWHKSLVAAVAGRALAKRDGEGGQDEAFLAGLLAYVGRLVLAECLPDVYLDVLAAHAPQWPTLEAEKGALGFHSADVAQALIASWRLPDLIGLPIAFVARPHELDAEGDPEARRLTELVGVAVAVAELLRSEDGGLELLELERRAAPMGLEGEALDAFVRSIEREVLEAADMLSIDLPRGESNEEILLRARGHVVQLSLDASADLATAERRADHLEDENRELSERATKDKLTGLHNRATFDEILEREVAKRVTGAGTRALGLLLLDVDHFKRFNDEHGHQAGDAVLEAVGRVLREEVRRSDHPARYGGEEFAVVLPQTTPTFLRMIANRIRAAIAAEVVEFEGEPLRVTASLGGVCIARASSVRDAKLLIKVADLLLYRAKENGRDRVEVYSKACLSAPRGEPS